MLRLGLVLTILSIATDNICGGKSLVTKATLPLLLSSSSRLDKRVNGESAIGLGDVHDMQVILTYTIQVQVGDTRTPLVLDTGSSDLWLVSDACSGDCKSAGVSLYSQNSLQPTGLDVQLLYGDSRTGTRASGPIGLDTVDIANLAISSQTLAAINDTNTTVFETGAAGILGLGFPPVSVIWQRLLQAELEQTMPTLLKRNTASNSSNALDVTEIGRPPFPSFDFLSSPSLSPHAKRQFGSSPLPAASAAIASFATFGPLLTRMILHNALDLPLISITLQRDTFELGGNAGQISFGGLPEGVQDDYMTWVPVRGYSVDEGGLPPSSDAPNETYPLVWEIPVDDVYFDGVQLPRSVLVSPAISVSALMDTGNSLIRGPKDVINHILARFGGPDSSFSCTTPHNLSFSIGGKLFPVDPRDFAQPVRTMAAGEARCTAALAATDPPGNGGFLFSWSLGDPFLKSALVAFYYGNLTHPSQDPPRIGLLSTVPPNAGQDLQSAVKAAADVGVFPEISEAAPTGAHIATVTGIGGVPQASYMPLVVLTSGTTLPYSMNMDVWVWLTLITAMTLWR
ncbi:acid protease [Wolfiporia cocos MD-104 SS10]|uniref:Acid protease n=1 Tax=Wolfiporia cocos (strain MD-104) TaxID=742152 RepID=A0A2H3J5A4_WOLCO|nr:acid protease [Wolfiporia cocos MD-104 SS10]